MSVEKLLTSMTRRELLAWIEYISQDWNKPSRTDHYIMQLSSILVQIMGSKKSSQSIDKYKIKFSSSKNKSSSKRQLTREEAASLAKGRWIALVGKPTIVQIPKEENNVSKT